MYRRARLPLPLVAGAIGIGIMSGSFIFRPALEEYWSQQPTADDASPAASNQPSQPTSLTEARASVPAPATALTRHRMPGDSAVTDQGALQWRTSDSANESGHVRNSSFTARPFMSECGCRDRESTAGELAMGKSMAPQPRWEMMSGFPLGTCSTQPEQLPDELPPGMPRACSHLYVKKSADRDLFHISVSPATSAGSRDGSQMGGDAEKPQGVRVLRGGLVSIVLYPMSPHPTDDMPRTAQSGPTFSSHADERAADDMVVLLMGGVSRANSPASSKRIIVRPDSGRSSPRRRARYPGTTITMETENA